MTDSPSTTSLGVALLTALCADRTDVELVSAALGDEPVRAAAGAASIGAALVDVIAANQGRSSARFLQALGLLVAQAEVLS